MVIGLDVFREYFAEFQDQYVIIGGTACDIILTDEGFTPRATKDIDLILVVEVLNRDFVSKFWQFIEDGGYEKKEIGEENRRNYRFTFPANKNFPKQIELSARKAELLDLPKDAHLTPIPTDDDLSNLSGVLMEDDYYAYTMDNSQTRDGLIVANTQALIVLKAKAFLNLLKKKNDGAHVDSKNISKHKGDVFRLGALLTEEDSYGLPTPLKADLQEFIDTIKDDLPGKDIFKALGAPRLDPKVVFDQIITSFKLNEEG